MTPVPLIPHAIAQELELSQAPEAKHIGYWREAEHPAGDTGYYGTQVTSCLEQQANFARESPEHKKLEREIARSTRLRDLMAQLPWPAHHCDPAMPKEDRHRLGHALNKIAPTMHYASASWDRLAWTSAPWPWECLFREGIGTGEVQRNGWVWPQGLAWYVFHYGLVLPQEFWDAALSDDRESSPAEFVKGGVDS